MAKRRSINTIAKRALTEDEAARQTANDAAAKAKTEDSFVNFEYNLGVGSQNMMTSSTYGFNPITRQRVLLEWIYRGSWLGGVAVDIKADDMTRHGIDILGELPPDGVQLIEEEATQLSIWTKINESLKWANLYGGAILVLLIDGQDISTPLRLSTIRKEQFKGVLSLDRWMVEPTLWDLVTEYGPELGEPKYYRVTAMAPALVNQKIHHSRVIRFEGIKLPYWQRVMENLWGLSVLERMYDRMIAFDSATTGAAQLVYKSYIRNYKIKNLRQIVAAGGDALNGLTKYVDMMRRFQGIEGMTLLDADDEFGADAHTAFGGLSDIMTRFMEQCAGSLQIPLCRLFGQSPSGFSTGDTDIRNYYDTVKQAQERDLRVGVTKIYRCIAASLGLKLPDGFGISFRSLYQLNDLEKAAIAEKTTATIVSAKNSDIIDHTTALKEFKQQAKVTGIFSNVTDSLILETSKKEPKPPENERIAQIRAQGTIEVAKIKTKAVKSKEVKSKATDSSALCAGIIFITPDNKMLVMKRANDGGEYADKWECPGGHIEFGETPEMAARRECYEEAGFAYFDKLEALPLHKAFAPYIAKVSAPFSVVINEEHTDYKWIDMADLDDTIHPELLNLLNRNYK